MNSIHVIVFNAKKLFGEFAVYRHNYSNLRCILTCSRKYLHPLNVSLMLLKKIQGVIPFSKFL